MTYRIYDLEEEVKNDFEQLHENGSGHVHDPYGRKVGDTDYYYARALNIDRGGVWSYWLEEYDRARWGFLDTWDEERYREEEEEYSNAWDEAEAAFMRELIDRVINGIIEEYRAAIKERRLETKRARKAR